ncbi:disease resistance protein L6-like [Syzygium oleosum]|uniref:disease resistance protein L6-like n=1 Tax=Syzygium oleosum TaxID=219896 RepID=UPI0024BBB930|nr:disease resistance protein L6-like [Syzygium oleosum]
MASSHEGTLSGSKYPVFLSFRGPDTREGFTDVLFHNLTDAGICVFRDDEELRVGERIDGSLQQAIDNSKIYMPVFSQNYASSQWCLSELTRILANTSKSDDNKEILPIFFDVKPDDVKLKNALYSDAILSLQHERELSNEQVDAWRKALKEVGAIKGWEVKKYNGHGKLIKLVVEEVVEKLKTKHRLVTKHLVGIDDRVVAVSKLFDIDSGDVRLIQIHGMGGIGKTTLAGVVFNQFSSHFGKYCCFLEDVRAKSSSIGLVELQKKLLTEIGVSAGTRSIDEIDFGMKRIGEVLHNKKVLIVLDDVDNSEQVKKLFGNGALYPGSRILITTRDKDVLQSYRLECQILEYEMEVMSIDHALQFFSKHAFDRNSPPKDYNDLSKEIVITTGTLPLALEVIGSLLYQKPQDEWVKTLEELRKAPHTNVYKKLKISYDALSFEQQQIFLDIASFFIHEDKTNAIYMWEECGLLRKDGVDVLNNRCLIKIAENNTFRMHDQLRVLGREIIREEDRMNPGNRSRLCIHNEVLGAIGTMEMKKNVQALDLDLRKSNLKDITSEEIGRFEDLRCLKLKGGTFVGDLTNCLTNLRWIFWSDPPRTSKPTNLHLKNVVVLVLSHNDFIDDSKLQSLIKMAQHLKVLSLESCHNITRTPNFSGWPNLERLTFDGCSRLRKIDGSIGKLRRLIDLKIHSCCSLEGLPEEIGDLENLKHFFAQRCEMKKLPESVWKLKSLREVYFSHHFDRLDSTYSWELPSAIGMLQKLEVLKDANCDCQIPSAIGSLSFLRILNLSHTHVSEIPKTVSMLSCLQRLELMDCQEIQELPALPKSLTHLRVSSKSLRVVPDLSNLINLVELDLNYSGEGGDKLCTGELRWIGRLSKLTKLSLRLQNVPAPAELASLPLLDQLDMFGMDMQTCPQLPLSLQKLGLDNFNPIVSIFPNLRNLSCFELCRSPMQEFQLEGLQLPHLRQLIVQLCVSLRRLTLSSMRKLKDVVVGRSPKLVEIQFSGFFESLEDLTIEWCESFERLVYVGEARRDNNESANEMITCEGRLILPLRALNKLKSFEMQGSEKISEILIVDTVESWEVFKVWSCPLLQSLRGLPNLKNLRSLVIQYCKSLQAVEGLDELEFLRRLILSNCQLLERLIDVSTTKLPDFCHLEISSCRKLREVKGGFEGSIQSFKHYKVS